MKKDDAIGARKRGEGLHKNFIAWYYATHQLTEGRPYKETLPKKNMVMAVRFICTVQKIHLRKVPLIVQFPAVSLLQIKQVVPVVLCAQTDSLF